MGDRLKGKNAVVTGAGRGIGRAVAVALAEQGANVVACDLGVAVDGNMPLEEVRAQEAEMMRDRESRLGTFKGSAVVGALPRDNETVRVFVRLDFETRSVFNVYLWSRQRILGLRGTPTLPPLRYDAAAPSAACCCHAGRDSGLTRAAFRNGKADPIHSAMKNPLRIKISKYCFQAIIAITATNA